jgi:hypothetical protein
LRPRRRRHLSRALSAIAGSLRSEADQIQGDAERADVMAHHAPMIESGRLSSHAVKSCSTMPTRLGDNCTQRGPSPDLEPCILLRRIVGRPP